MQKNRLTYYFQYYTICLQTKAFALRKIEVYSYGMCYLLLVKKYFQRNNPASTGSEYCLESIKEYAKAYAKLVLVLAIGNIPRLCIGIAEHRQNSHRWCSDIASAEPLARCISLDIATVPAEAQDWHRLFRTAG